MRIDYKAGVIEFEKKDRTRRYATRPRASSFLGHLGVLAGTFTVRRRNIKERPFWSRGLGACLKPSRKEHPFNRGLEMHAPGPRSKP